MTETLQTMVSFFTKGGLFMWPLLACSIVTVTTIILSILTLRERKVLPLVIESEIERLVPGGSAERLARIVQRRQFLAGPDHARGACSICAGRVRRTSSSCKRGRAHEMVRLERGLIVLEVITGIAPLIGLIGTVSGLVQVFSGLGLEHRRGGHQGRRARHFRGAELHHLRSLHRGAELDRLQLFLEKGRSDVGGNGIDRLGFDRQMLLRPNRPRGRPRRCAQRLPAQRPASCDARLGFVAMKIAVRKRRAPSIIIVSLVDILTILLIFFVVSTTFKKDQPEVQINLPESKTATNAPAELEHAIVSVNENDEIRLDGQVVSVG